MAVSVAVDPGYDRVGIAVFDGKTLVHSECYSPERGALPDRLSAIHTHLSRIIKKYRPASLAIESLFFSKNQKTALHVAEARGAILVAARAARVEVHEYSPQAVKIAVTGVGNAGKDGVIRMVERLVELPRKKRLDDEYDAIALGICHTTSNPHTHALQQK